MATLSDEEINSIFTYHAPTGNQPARYETLRSHAREMALLIRDLCPDSRERSLAITNLQQCVMMANASIAIHETPATSTIGCV